MYGDLSRLIFDPTQHYSRVVVQQGRVTLDADANEEASILLHYLRALAADLIGPLGGPGADPGFEIGHFAGEGQVPFTIGLGHYYVDGILCEADGTAGSTDPIGYFDQPDVYHDQNDPRNPLNLPGTPYLIWLKVWERYISWAEDPDLREVALGLDGPDTTGRTRVVWQVLAWSWPDPNHTPETAQDFYDNFWSTTQGDLLNPPTGTLMAQAAQPPKVETDACILPPSSGYRGAENQLYRVEINRDGTVSASPTASAETTPPPTFKWSRDNGCVILPITGISGNVVSVTTLGRDPQLSVEVGNYVEIFDDYYASQGSPGAIPRYLEPLHLVTAVDAVGLTVTLDQAPSTNVGRSQAPGQSLHPYLRRWDQEEVLVTKADLTIDSVDKAIDLVTDRWIDLEDGIQIKFSYGSYRAGDYWLIPARVVTGDVEWPEDASGNKLPLSPMGVDYHAAPLAFVPAGGAAPTDLRMGFQPMAQFLPLTGARAPGGATQSAAGPTTRQAGTTRQARSATRQARSTTRQARSTTQQAGLATPQSDAPSAGTPAQPAQGQQPAPGKTAD